MATGLLRGPSFRLKLSLLAVVVAVVPVVAVGFIVNDVNRDTLTKSNEQLIESVTENVMLAVQRKVASADRALHMVAAALADLPEVRNVIIESALDEGESFRELGFYNECGVQIKTVENRQELSPPPLPERLPDDLWKPGVLTYGPVVFSHGAAYVLRTLATNEPPARPDSRKVKQGIDVSRCPTSDPPARMVATYMALGEAADQIVKIGTEYLPKGRIAVVTPTRVAVADSLVEGVGRTLDGASFGALPMLEARLGKATDHLIDSYTRTDGTQVVEGVRSIEGTPFTILAAQPYDVVYHSIASVRWVVAVTVLVAILIAIAAGVLLARRMTRPIQALVQFAGDLSQRRFDTRLTVRTRDELGVLGTALQRAAQDLAASEIQIQEEQAIRGDLRRYLPGPLVDEIVARKRSLALGGERREISVLFADVVGFTPLAERESAETVVALLNELFTILTEIVFRHGGTVDKFVGDCVMALWGASEPQPDHAARAIAAARDMQRWLQVGNELWREKYGVTIEIAIGVNSGEAVVGNFGSETRMEFTAIGDVVNVAARLEAIARPDQILATAATRGKAADDRGWVSLGVRPIIGKAHPIEIFEVRA